VIDWLSAWPVWARNVAAYSWVVPFGYLWVKAYRKTGGK
jgi:hypothetical protein